MDDGAEETPNCKCTRSLVLGSNQWKSISSGRFLSSTTVPLAFDDLARRIYAYFEHSDDAVAFQGNLFDRGRIWAVPAGHTPPEVLIDTASYLYITLEDALKEEIERRLSGDLSPREHKLFEKAMDAASRGVTLRLATNEIPPAGSDLSSRAGSHSMGHSNLPLVDDDSNVTGRGVVRVAGSHRAPSGGTVHDANAQGGEGLGLTRTGTAQNDNLAAMAGINLADAAATGGDDGSDSNIDNDTLENSGNNQQG